MNDLEKVDVRIYRIGPSGTGGRGPVVVGAFVAVLVTVVGFAALGARNAEPAPSEAAVASEDASPRPSRTRRPTVAPTRPPVLPTYPNDRLPGAPLVALGRATGNGLQIYLWTAGNPSVTEGSLFADILNDPTADAWTNVDLSPHPAWRGRDATGVAQTNVFDPQGGPPRATTRVFGPAGTLWQGEETGYYLTTLWSIDGSFVAVGGAPVWTIVRIGPDGSATARSTRVADDPPPAPFPTGEFGHFEPPPMPFPFAYSADGRWLYGALGHDTPPTFRAVVRVDLRADPLVVEPVDRFPRGRDRLAPTGGYADLVDPLTGRMAELDYRAAEARLVIYEPDGSPAPDLFDQPVNVGSHTWIEDGDLVVTAMYQEGTDGGPGRAEVLRVDGDGSGSAVLLSAERVDGAWIVGSRPGFVLLGFWAAERMLLVLLRTADGATASIEVPRELLNNLNVIELVDR